MTKGADTTARTAKNFFIVKLCVVQVREVLLNPVAVERQVSIVRSSYMCVAHLSHPKAKHFDFDTD